MYIIYSRSYIHCCLSYTHMLFTFSSGSVRLRLAQGAFSLRGRNMVTLLYGQVQDKAPRQRASCIPHPRQCRRNFVYGVILGADFEFDNFNFVR